MSSLPVLAGIASTLIFAVSTMPMLHKAVATRDLASYSLGNLVLANVGNMVHSVYVLHLPPGPIWVLHGFYMASSGLMLVWYLLFRPSPPMRDRLPRRTLASAAIGAPSIGHQAGRTP